MRRLGLLAILLCALAGCNTIRPKHDNPVMQPAPRRVSWDDSRAGDSLVDAAKPAEVKQASATDGDDDSQIYNAKVVARVNGAPVFAGDILVRWGPYLQQAKKKLPPDQYAEYRSMIIQKNLRNHIERRLLAERLKSSLKTEQVQQLETFCDKLFQKQIDKLKDELKVSTKTELELKLNEQGTTLDAVKEDFITQQLAVEYVKSHIERPRPIGRPDLVSYYQSHLDDYKIPAKVRWQQVQVSWNGKTSQPQARTRIQQAHGALERGQPFELVAKQFSDGPTATSGGEWDWTSRGALAEQKLEDAIFELPIGQLSPVIEGKTAFHIVQVVDRQAESRTPFGDVQDDIAKKLEQSLQQNLPQQFVQQLFDEAIIETAYDLSADDAKPVTR
jgi:parvulin-like peptidyl-prolyl isomerase